MILKNKILRFFKYLYIKLVRINDSPSRIALGLAIGVFFGVVPFAGAAVSLLAAIFLKANKLAALIGCFLTNTWVTFVCAIVAINVGAFVFKINKASALNDCYLLMKNFSPSFFSKIASRDFFLPLLVGFILTALLFSIGVYIFTWSILSLYRNVRKLQDDKRCF